MVYSLSFFLIVTLASIASAATVVSVDPFNQNLDPGQTFNVNVRINSGTDLVQSAHVELNFNTTVLTANSVTSGNLLGTDVLNEPTNGISSGKVKYGLARTSTNPATTVNGNFITVNFQVKNSAPGGISILDLVNVEMMNTATSAITGIQSNDGQVNVSGTSNGGGDDNGNPSNGGADDNSNGIGNMAVVSVIPASKNVVPGEAFTVQVNIDSGNFTVQSAHVELNFNTSVLTANTVSSGSLFGADILSEPSNGITTGKVKFGEARTSSNPATTENGTFINVNFQVKTTAPAGLSLLDLMNVELMKNISSSITSKTVNDGQVTVIIGPLPPEELKWKLISVPYLLNNSNVSFVLQGINYTELYAWDAVGKTWISPVTKFVPLQGYLIKMETSKPIVNLEKKPGAFIPPSLVVTKGWNLIGTSGATSMDAETMLQAIDDSYYSIWNWDVANQRYDPVVGFNTAARPAGSVGTNAFTMQPGISYWVWATKDASLPAIGP